MNFTIFSDLYSKKICAKLGIQADTMFQLKGLYSKMPGVIVFMVATISTLVLGYVLRIFERYD
jgi:hypothetical protein